MLHLYSAAGDICLSGDLQQHNLLYFCHLLRTAKKAATPLRPQQNGDAASLAWRRAVL